MRIKSHILAVLIMCAIPWQVHGAQLTATWTDASNNELTFEIHRSATGGNDFAKVATVGTNVQTYTDTGLAESVRYYYKVNACNTAGCSAFTPIVSAITVVAIPGTPTGLTATPFPGEVRLTWPDAATETYYELDRSLTGLATEFAKIATPGANVTAYTDANLAEAVKYYYRLRQCNTAGCSASGAIVSATTPLSIPATPGGLTVTPLP